MSSNTLQTSTVWTHAHESILKEWKAKAFAYLWLQNNSCYFYIRLHNWLAYIVIVLSSFASATMFSLNTTNGSCETPLLGISIVAVQYVVGTVSLLSAILTGVIRQLKPGELYQQHASTAKRYHTLIRSIDACLSLTCILRPDPAIFIEKAGAELDNLANNQVDPPLSVIKKFEEIYGPLERILYGEDVVELWKIRYQTSRMEAKMRKSFNSSNMPTSKDNSHDMDTNNEPQDVYKSRLYSFTQKLENVVVPDDKDPTVRPQPQIGTQGVDQNATPQSVMTSVGGGGFILQNITEPFRTSILKQSQTFKTT